MKRNIILKELIGAPDKENDEDFDDNIFKGELIISSAAVFRRDSCMFILGRSLKD